MDKQKIGNLIMQLRLAKNLSQTELAKGICTQSFLSRLESGGTEITLQKVIQLLHRTNTTLSEFEYMYLANDPTFAKKEELHQQFFSLRFHLIPTNNLSLSLPYMNEMLDCFNQTFETNFSLQFEPDYSYLPDLLLQDEFFNNDYAPILFALPKLSLEAAIYTSTRLLDQFTEHQIAKSQPYLPLLIKIVMSHIFYANNEQGKAIILLIETADDARKQSNTNYLIVILLMLYKHTTQKIYLKEAFHLNELFLKDNFYEYWYNVLIE